MKSITCRLFIGAFLICFVTTGFCAYAHVSKSTNAFIQSAEIGNQFEISSSRLALQNSQSGDIKQFAQHMIDDHSKIASDMKQTLSSSGLMPNEPNASLDPSHQKMIDTLSRLSGKDFDEQYVEMQVTAHDSAVSLFRDYAKNGDKDALKSFAAKTLPTLQQHQKDIHEISASF